MLTAKKFADEIGNPYSTVALWLKDNRIPEAERHELEGEKIFYLIPAAVVEKYKSATNQPKRGRPKAASTQVEEADTDEAEGADGKSKRAKSASAHAVKDEHISAEPKRRASKRSPAKKANVTRSTKKK